VSGYSRPLCCYCWLERVFRWNTVRNTPGLHWTEHVPNIIVIIIIIINVKSRSATTYHCCTVVVVKFEPNQQTPGNSKMSRLASSMNVIPTLLKTYFCLGWFVRLPVSTKFTTVRGVASPSIPRNSGSSSLLLFFSLRPLSSLLSFPSLPFHFCLLPCPSFPPSGPLKSIYVVWASPAGPSRARPPNDFGAFSVEINSLYYVEWTSEQKFYFKNVSENDTLKCL